jgi:hypothetical protein
MYLEGNSIGNENRLNTYLNLRVHDSIFTEGKNFTREEGRKDREVQRRDCLLNT